jgi:hypothetical protein
MHLFGHTFDHDYYFELPVLPRFTRATFTPFRWCCLRLVRFPPPGAGVLILRVPRAGSLLAKPLRLAVCHEIWIDAIWITAYAYF